ncbi:MAG: sialate O-acetylesterase [Pirellulaceae bacterium]
MNQTISGVVMNWLRYFVCLIVPSVALAQEPANEPWMPKQPIDQAASHEQPVQVFILMGQSNMVGMGDIMPEDKQGTLSHLVDHEGRYSYLKNAQGDWAKRNDVFYYDARVKKGGPLNAFANNGTAIGPELGFGFVMGDQIDKPVLILKSCIGNRSLGWDLLPPGSEQFTVDGKTYAGYRDTPDWWIEGEPKREVNWYAGKQYDDDMANAKAALERLSEIWPEHGGQGYEIAGFVWWQGHKDQNAAHSSRYESNLERLIKTLRKDYDAPNAKFVLATIGFNGWKLDGPGKTIADAQLAISDPQRYPDFVGNVATVESRDLWREADASPKNQGYHYNRNAETYLEVGLRLGQAMSELLDGTKPKADVDRSSKLRVLNGTEKTVEVLWKPETGEAVSQGQIAPGKDTRINTTIGHRFEIKDVDGAVLAEIVCEVPHQAYRVGGVPDFYSQHESANGLPIVASEQVSPFALKEAAYIVDSLLAERPDVRDAMIKSGSRLCILAHNEFTTEQPEWAWLGRVRVPGVAADMTKDYRDARARGMGGSATDPFCSCAEENLLAFAGDPYSTECILIHELAHNIHLRGMNNVDRTFDQRVKATYDAAMSKGLWAGKYASVNYHEYFAEGVQSWFDNNRENDHDHNHVNTRAELVEYDPGLAALCEEVFGNTEFRYTKPATRLHGHLSGFDPSTAPRFEWPKRLEYARKIIFEQATNRSKPSDE